VSIDGKQNIPTTWRRVSVFSIWVLALTSAVIITIFSPPKQYFSALSIALAACVLVTLIVQLCLQQKIGFVDRITTSVIGSVTVLGVTTVVLLIATLIRT
jgi:hypothetical protein